MLNEHEVIDNLITELRSRWYCSKDDWNNADVTKRKLMNIKLKQDTYKLKEDFYDPT